MQYVIKLPHGWNFQIHIKKNDRKENKMYIRIFENDDWIVEYDIQNNQYRVGYFQDYHFVDQVLFDAYKEEED